MNPINIDDEDGDQNAKVNAGRLEDIFGYIKNGNIKMIHALIQANNVQNLMLLKGHEGVFILNEQELSMKEWNPLLVALAYKQSEVLKYLIGNAKLSVRVAGRDPRYSFIESINSDNYKTEKIQRQMFCIDITIQNEDLECLHLLWDQY